MNYSPFLIIGGGVAGLSLAIKLATRGKVTVLIKGSLTENNSYYAQGGIAGVLDKDDSFEAHVKDTLSAGAGLCHDRIVELVVKSGPERIKELIDLGVPFTKEDEGQGFHLTREGGHTARRVIHAEDLTGKAVMQSLIAKVNSDPNIQLIEKSFAVDLLTTEKLAAGSFEPNKCLGAYVLNLDTNRIETFRSAQTFLCTGGHGKAYLYTSNPDSATGDGLAMGWRAGCRVANLEFMQFHPTCLFHPRAKSFLISEAVRGEGGVLKDLSGREFMQDYHVMGSLAPRDIVARAIDSELKKSGDSHVVLDVTHLASDKLEKHFPNILQVCLNFGIDIRKEPIPVVPAAHYSCGGVVVDEWGRTSIERLYALGEVACTGLHGANRLASNSLLEALVFAERCFEHAVSQPLEIESLDIPPWDSGKTIPSDEQVVLTHTWDELRRLMWHYVGIVRSDKRLARALTRIRGIREELDTYYWSYQINDKLLEVRNLAEAAYLTVSCAMMRKESRGIHFNMDYPDLLPVKPRDSIHR